MHSPIDVHRVDLGITSCIRTISGAEPDKRRLVFDMMAREAVGYARRGGIDVQDVIDRLHDTAVSTGLLEEHGEDEIQAALADAMIDRVATPLAPADDGPLLAPPALAATSLQFLDPAQWQDVAVPERSWVVPRRVPAGAVTLLYGDGAAGKTLIALQLAVAVVTGTDWLCACIDHPPAGRVAGRVVGRDGGGCG